MERNTTAINPNKRMQMIAHITLVLDFFSTLSTLRVVFRTFAFVLSTFAFISSKSFVCSSLEIQLDLKRKGEFVPVSFPIA
jgi:hypothetical protein